MSRHRNKLDVPEEDWAEARERESVIRGLLQFRRLSRVVVEEACASLKIRPARLYSLLTAYKLRPLTSSLLAQKPGRNTGDMRLSPETERIIEESISSSFLSRQKPKIAHLHRDIVQDCQRCGAKPPSRKSVQARIDRIPRSKVLAARESREVASAIYEPKPGEYRQPYALKVVEIDHTKVDLFLVDEKFRMPIARPWLTLAIDVSSRMIFGFHLSLSEPSAISVAMAMRHGVLPKEEWLAELGISAPWPVSGIPDAIHTDNGKDFHSEALERGLQEYGIGHIFRPPYRKWYGGHIERLIGTVMGEVHLLPGTTFSNIDERGEYDPEKHAALTLREAEHWLAIHIVGRYHADIHSALSRPPIAVWEDAVSARPGPIRHPVERANFIYDFLPFEYRKVTRTGIELFRIEYWDDVLSTPMFQGDEKLRIKYDPRNLYTVFVEAPDGTHWPIRCRNLGRPEITLWEHREARKALRAQGRAEVNERLIFDAVEAKRALVAEAAAQTKVARRNWQRTRDALTSSRQTYADPRAGLPLPPNQEFDEAPEAEPLGGIAELPFEVEDWS